MKYPGETDYEAWARNDAEVEERQLERKRKQYSCPHDYKLTETITDPNADLAMEIYTCHCGHTKQEMV